MDPGVQVIPGQGHVLVRGPVAMVLSGSVAAAQDANILANGLYRTGQWDFESVASVLQELVTEHDLMGIAAVTLYGSAPTLFLFDGAEAVVDGATVAGEGREAWVTEALESDSVELRLTGARAMPPQHGTELRDGVVTGAGALVSISTGLGPPSSAGVASVASLSPQPPAPADGPPLPPPHEVPPPPRPAAGLGRPTRVPAPAPPPPVPEPTRSVDGSDATENGPI